MVGDVLTRHRQVQDVGWPAELRLALGHGEQERGDLLVGALAAEQQHLPLRLAELDAGLTEQRGRQLRALLDHRLQALARVADQGDRRDRLDAVGIAGKAGQAEALVGAQEIQHLATAIGDRVVEAHRARDDPVVMGQRIALDQDGLAGRCGQGDAQASPAQALLHGRAGLERHAVCRLRPLISLAKKRCHGPPPACRSLMSINETVQIQRRDCGAWP